MSVRQPAVRLQVTDALISSVRQSPRRTVACSASNMFAGIAPSGMPDATAAAILVHGRGGSARDILSLAPELQAPGLALIVFERRRAKSARSEA